MARKSHGLVAHVFALEKTIAGMFAGKKTEGKRSKKTSVKKAPKRTKKKKTTKVPKPKATKKNKRNTSKSRVAPPTMEQLVPDGEPLFVTPIKSEEYHLYDLP